jgi:hydroxypyruvate isomerase
MLKFCANLSLLFTEYDFINRFKAARNAGFKAVEMQFPYALSAQDIRQQLDTHQLELVLFNVDAGDLLQGGEGLAAVPELQWQFEQALQQTVEYARILKPQCINVLPGRCYNPKRLQDYNTTFKRNLLKTVEALQPLDITTVFEAINTLDMPDFIIHNSGQMVSLLNEINHPGLKMQYDIYHMQRMQQSILEFIQQYADQIGHFQFADVPGRGQPGTGSMDYETLFAAIENSSYSGWIGAEYHPTVKTEDSLHWFHAYLSH